MAQSNNNAPSIHRLGEENDPLARTRLSPEEFHSLLREPERRGVLFPDFRAFGTTPTAVKERNKSLHKIFKLLHLRLGLEPHNIEHAISLYTSPSENGELSEESETALLRLCCVFPSKLRGLCLIGAPESQNSLEKKKLAAHVPRVWRDPCIIPFPISDLERRRRINAVWLEILHAMRFGAEPGVDPWTPWEDHLVPIPSSVMNWQEERVHGDRMQQVPRIKKKFIRKYIYPLYEQIHETTNGGVDPDVFVVICNALTEWQLRAFVDEAENLSPRANPKLWMTKLAWEKFSTLTVNMKPKDVEPNRPWVVDFLPDWSSDRHIYLSRSRDDQKIVSTLLQEMGAGGALPPPIRDRLHGGYSKRYSRSEDSDFLEQGDEGRQYLSSNDHGRREKYSIR